MDVRVVGLFYREREHGPVVREVVERLSPETGLRLEREPDNEHDPNAIMVLASDEEVGEMHIGYIPRDQAGYLGPLLDGGETIGATFTETEAVERGNGPPTLYPHIELSFEE